MRYKRTSLTNPDRVLDRIPPQSLLNNVVNLTYVPSPHLAWRLELNDGSFHINLIPVGSRWTQLALYFLLAVIPILTATGAAWLFVKSFYQIKFNQFGVAQSKSILPMAFRRKFQPLQNSPSQADLSFFARASRGTFAFVHPSPKHGSTPPVTGRSPTPTTSQFMDNPLGADAGAPNRRMVLIATMEYDIEDWGIKIKIGGLGVMAQLMGKNLGHQDLIWVVPCVGGIDYPETPRELAEPMEVTVLGQIYQVGVRTHVLRNITYVLLDAPVFRQQTKSEPYPPRMDDLDSAIYYSAWNSCIAEAIKRFKPDLYHINDYHGSVAPLHLLPDTIPCALSLHNAEFQGLWPMRSKQEREEVCKIYNLDPDIVQEYVQFGEVFNLLHAAASYLRMHQNGFGAVGVSKKYGKRSYARYPIFWGLKDIGALPNPDPSDTAEWRREDEGKVTADAKVDPDFEAGRAALRTDAQQWAGLNVDPTAELFVFVGRWSMQKGVDLIADIFPSILEKHPKTQLICIGPVIDLYGKFAAIKLGKMMQVYKGRVFSKPEFTALPPYIFSGAEFALIPSRDEPFGLVAVEFGRKGALGVGARVGGLGQMPGWWYTIESTSTKHLLHQFKGAIEGALESSNETRALLRARSARQRFPVAQWVEDLETLQSTAIRKHEKYANKGKHNLLSVVSGKNTPSGHRSRASSAVRSRANSAHRVSAASAAPSTAQSRASSPPPPATTPEAALQTLQRMGSRNGPGHAPRRRLDRLSGATAISESRDSYPDDIFDDYSSEDEEGQERPRGRSLQAGDFVQPQNFLSAAFNGSLGRTEEPAGLALRDTSPNLHRLPSFQESPRVPLTAQLGQQENTSLLGIRNTTPRAHFGSPSESNLSLASIVGEKKDFELQKVNPFFTDVKRDYTKAFEKKLANLNAKNSYNTCIEEFIEKSEKDWFNRYREVKMGRTPTPASSIFRGKEGHSPPGSIFNESFDEHEDGWQDQFLLADDYKTPTGVKKFLLHRLGDWPVYSLLLALVSSLFGSRQLISTYRSRDKSLLPTHIKSPFLQAKSARRLQSSTPLPRFIS